MPLTRSLARSNEFIMNDFVLVEPMFFFEKKGAVHVWLQRGAPFRAIMNSFKVITI